LSRRWRDKRKRRIENQEVASGAPNCPRLMHTDGADAARRAIGAADYHPLSVRRFAPAIQRMQRTIVHASKLARPPAADPQPR
jgi:hypothetical protein